MRRAFVVAVATLGLWACGQAEGDAEVATDTLTRAQKDSIIANIPLPGASGITDAMDAVQKANERTARHDSIG